VAVMIFGKGDETVKEIIRNSRADFSGSAVELK
jgi:hypothetical protein